MENILQQIYQSSLKLLEPLSLQNTYQIIVKEATILVNGNYGSLVLKEHAGFKEVYSTLPVKVKPRKKGFTYKTFKEQKVSLIHIPETKKYSEVHPELIKIGIRSVILIPLSYRKKSIGVLSVNSLKKEHFTKRELDILLLFGSMATLAIRKNHLHQNTIQALKTRDFFISLAVHEIRTPLTSISGYTQLLLSKLSKNPQAPETKWAQKLSEETTRLTHMTSELLQAGRIQTGRIEYELKITGLNKILDKAIDNFHFKYPKHNFIITSEIEKKRDKIVADSEKLLQVFSNILDNAAKYTPTNKKIGLIVKEKSEFFVIHIIDEGKGIAKKDLSKIFQEFYKGKNAVQGMGLGLFLAKNIIEAHKGSISARSEVHKGTAIEIKLPLAKI